MQQPYLSKFFLSPLIVCLVFLYWISTCTLLKIKMLSRYSDHFSHASFFLILKVFNAITNKKVTYIKFILIVAHAHITEIPLKTKAIYTTLSPSKSINHNGSTYPNIIINKHSLSYSIYQA